VFLRIQQINKPPTPRKWRNKKLSKRIFSYFE
jgi:hypothetical protein